MAKTSKSAEPNPTPAPTTVQTPATAARSGQPATLPDYTELQQDPTAFVDRVAALFEEGEAPSDTAAPAAKETPPEPPANNAGKEASETPGRQTPPAEEEEEPPPPAAKGTKAILPDDPPAPGHDPEAEADESELPAEISGKLFKLRQSRRELRDKLDAQTKELEALKAAKAEAVTSALPAVPDMPPEYAHIRSDTELENTEAWLQERMDMVTDSPDGFDDRDETGNAVFRDADYVRKHKAQLRQWLRTLPAARKALAAATARQSQASARAAELYPFVRDPSRAQHSVVQDLAARHPELAAHPERDLILGRLAVAALVENGTYELRRKGAASSAPAASPPPQAVPAAKPAPAPAVTTAPEQPVPPRTATLSSHSPEALAAMMQFLADPP